MLYASAMLLVVGVFLPLTTFAIIGDVSYNRVAEMESYVVILFAISAPALLFIKQQKLIFASIMGVWITLLLPAIQSLVKPEDSSMLGKLSSKASGVMQEYATNWFLNIFEFSWGGFVFLAGLILFTITGIMRALK